MAKAAPKAPAAPPVEPGTPAPPVAAEPKEPTAKEVAAKVSKGEKLSEHETEVFKGIPPGGMPPITAVEPPAEPTTETELEKVPDAPPAKEPELTDARKQEILAEADKPDDQVDLSKFKSHVEVSLYWDLKKQRVKNQKLRDENETLKIKALIEDYNKTKKPDAPDPFDDLQPDDVLSVQEVKDRIAKAKAAAPPEPKGEQRISTEALNQIRIQKVEADSRLRAKGLTDFHEVVDFAGEALGGDQDATLILQEVSAAGGNVAEKTYWLIKGSAAWPEIEKKIKAGKPAADAPPAPPPAAPKAPPAEHVEQARRFENNSGKTVTTGAGAPGNSGKAEYTMAEISNMTHHDVARLPREVRQQILKKYGSTPNLQ